MKLNRDEAVQNTYIGCWLAPIIAANTKHMKFVLLIVQPPSYPNITCYFFTKHKFELEPVTSTSSA